MNSEWLYRLIGPAIVGSIFGYGVWAQAQREDFGEESYSEKRPKYTAVWNGCMVLPCFFCFILLFAVLRLGPSEGLFFTFSQLLGTFFHISVYCAILLILLPLLRRFISSRACAFLWMMPAGLYLIHFYGREQIRPRLVLNIPFGKWIIYLWFAGFLLFIGYKILSHMLFRREILTNATEIKDLSILEIWESEQQDLGFTEPYLKLYTSSNITTPLSIGLLPKTIRVVLPPVRYTDEELHLLFRHELVHISREDCATKLFLTFCTAMCWFNPLMWLAMEKSAEDIELSCDETVLIHADSETRKKYADLILNTAGNAKGFTTCLSATASSLRYRLKSIVHPSNASTGAYLVAILFIILGFTYGNISLTYGETNAADAVWGNKSPAPISYITIAESGDGSEGRSIHRFKCTDPDALHSYLNSLTLKEMVNHYSFRDGSKKITLAYAPEGPQVILRDRFIELHPEPGSRKAKKLFYTEKPIDFSYLRSLMMPDPILAARLAGVDDQFLSLDTTLLSLEKGRGSHPQPCSATPPAGSRNLSLGFYETLTSPMILEITLADGSESWCLTPDSQNYLPIPDEAMNCTAYVEFEGDDGSIYHGIYQFQIDSVKGE